MFRKLGIPCCQGWEVTRRLKARNSLGIEGLGILPSTHAYTSISPGWKSTIWSPKDEPSPAKAPMQRHSHKESYVSTNDCLINHLASAWDLVRIKAIWLGGGGDKQAGKWPTPSPQKALLKYNRGKTVKSPLLFQPKPLNPSAHKATYFMTFSL